MRTGRGARYVVYGIVSETDTNLCFVCIEEGREALGTAEGEAGREAGTADGAVEGRPGAYRFVSVLLFVLLTADVCD